jgi:hypothetical protein
MVFFFSAAEKVTFKMQAFHEQNQERLWFSCRDENTLEMLKHSCP